MLIKKKPAINDVVAVRLSTREEIIGRMTASDDKSVTLAKPLALQLHQTPNGMALGFAPYGLSTAEDETVVFNRDHIVSDPLHVRDDVKQSYVQATSSIQPAPAGGLIG